MYIGASFGKRRIRIWVRDIFTGEEWNVSVCPVYVLFYSTNPMRWDMSAEANLQR